MPKDLFFFFREKGSTKLKKENQDRKINRNHIKVSPNLLLHASTYCTNPEEKYNLKRSLLFQTEFNTVRVLSYFYHLHFLTGI